MNQEAELNQLERDIRAKVDSNGVYKDRNGASRLDLSNSNLHDLPNISDIIINGNLDVSNNKLKNLVGAPNKVVYLNAFGNQIDTLVGSPQEIRMINVGHNNLKSFKGISPKVKDVYAYDNPIESFERLPKKLIWFTFTCDNVKSWDHFPLSIEYVVIDGNIQSIQLKGRLRIIQSVVVGNYKGEVTRTVEMLKRLFSKE